jgi:hypothetical protein
MTTKAMKIVTRGMSAAAALSRRALVAAAPLREG